MNRWILRLLAGVAVTQIGAVGNAIAHQNVSVTPDEEAWERTASVNTLEAYAKFSMDFPQSRHVRQARSRLTALTTEDADKEVDAAVNEPASTFVPDFVPNSIMVV